ncbi:MAG: RNA polymerase sigma factor [Myxococcota bacterium]
MDQTTSFGCAAQEMSETTNVPIHPIESSPRRRDRAPRRVRRGDETGLRRATAPTGLDVTKTEQCTRERIVRERDLDWVARVRVGDQTAYAELHAAYSGRIQAFIYKQIRDVSEAEDLTQETFFQLYRSFESYDGRSSLLTWTFGIAQNVCLHYFRHCSRWMVGSWNARELDDRPSDAAIERRVEATRVLERCDAALATGRRPAHQVIFRLRYAESRSVRSIAEQVGKTSEAVKVSLRLSRSFLVESVPELAVVPGRSGAAARGGSSIGPGSSARCS